MPGNRLIAQKLIRLRGMLPVPCLLFSAAVMAATPVPGYTPGQIERQLDDSQPVTTPTIGEAVSVKRTTDGPATSQPSFTLSAVLIEGVSVYHSVDFLPLYQQLLGKPVTYAQLEQLANAITRRYREDGYLLAHAYIPAQQINYGVVRIQLREGYIHSIDYGRPATDIDVLVRQRVQPLLEQRPLTRDRFQQSIVALRALPDIDITPSVSEAATERGAFVLHLAMRQKRADGVVTVDNRGSELVGPVKGIVMLRSYNISGRHETYRARLATTTQTQELHFAEIATDWPVTAAGLVMHASGFRTTSQPGGSLADYNVSVDNHGLSLGLTYPLLMAFDRRLDLSGELSHYQSRTLLNNAPYLEDRLNHVTIRLADIRKLASGSLWSYKLELSHGLGAGDTYSRNLAAPERDAAADFTKAGLDIHYQHSLFGDRELVLSAAAQYALNTLPNSQRFSVGGSRFSGANDPSEISGDHGLGTRIELLGKRHQPFAGLTSRLFSYYGIGAIENRNNIDGDSQATAASFAVGMRFFAMALSGFIEAAKPLTRPVAEQGADGKDVRVFTGLTLRF